MRRRACQRFEPYPGRVSLRRPLRMALPYPRDVIGYGPQPPDPKWPGGARLAVQFVINYGEGGENCILHGDTASEAFLSEIVGAQPYAGLRRMDAAPPLAGTCIRTRHDKSAPAPISTSVMLNQTGWLSPMPGPPSSSSEQGYPRPRRGDMLMRGTNRAYGTSHATIAPPSP